jgi:hypothetical protein
MPGLIAWPPQRGVKQNVPDGDSCSLDKSVIQELRITVSRNERFFSHQNGTLKHPNSFENPHGRKVTFFYTFLQNSVLAMQWVGGGHRNGKIRQTPRG